MTTSDVKFTAEQQERMNAIIARETKPLRARIAELEPQVATLTTERDTAVNALAEATTTHAAAIEAANATAAEHAARYGALTAGQHVTRALQATGALPVALTHALELFQRTHEIELAEDGTSIAKVKRAGAELTLDVAARDFLASQPWLRAAGPGGGGIVTPNSGTVVRTADLSPQQLVEQGLREAPL